jgi:type I restriction enzyme M protein
MVDAVAASSVPVRTWRDRAIAEITQLDSTHSIVVEISQDSIRYNRDHLTLRREISQATDEELVRALTVCRLHYDHGYPLDAIELEVPYKAGRPKVIKPRIDIIVRDSRKARPGPAFLFIEVKAPDKFDLDQNLIEGQLFELALLEAKNGPVRYLVYASVSADDALDDRLIIVDFEKFPTFEQWQSAGTISLDELPRNYGQAAKRRFVNVDRSAPHDPLSQPLDISTTPEAFFGLRKHLHNVLGRRRNVLQRHIQQSDQAIPGQNI